MRRALPLVEHLAGDSLTVFPTNALNFKAEVSIWPPDQYRSDNAAVTLFVSPEALSKICGTAAESGKAIIGCASILKNGTPIVVLPNPCLMDADDFYAGIACHELAHVNGWRHADTPTVPPATPAPSNPEPDPLNIALSGRH